MIPAPSDGEPALELVVSAGNGRESLFLKEGDTKYIGSHMHSISFMGIEDADIRIVRKSDSLYVSSKEDIDVFIMATQEATTIKGGFESPMKFNALHRFHDLSFVPVRFMKNARLKWVSKAQKPKDNSDVVDDMLILELKSGEDIREVELPYRHGFLPKFKAEELNGLQVKLGFGSLSIPAGFHVKLRDFILERYPGSTSPSAYTSEVTIQDAGEEFDYSIFMNHVLDYKGYRFFQASYDTDEQGTVLSVNHDRAGTLVTYIGYFMMGLGMFLTLFWRGSRFRWVLQRLEDLKEKQSKEKYAKIAIVLILLAGSYAPLYSQTVETSHEPLIMPAERAESFGRLLVQDLDGRIKPINTLASEFLRKVARKTSYPFEGKRLSPDQVFLSVHMDPDTWTRMPLITYDRKKLSAISGQLPDKGSKLVSFTDFLDENGDYILEQHVLAANKKKPAERSEFDKEIINIDERFNIIFNVVSGHYLKIFPKKDDPSNTWYDFTYDFADFNEEDGRFCSSILPIYFSSLKQGLETNQWSDSENNLSYIEKYQQVLAREIVPKKKQLEAELWYNKLNLNFWLFQSYFLLGIALLSLALIRVFRSGRFLQIGSRLVVLLCLLSFAIHTSNLLLRWYIAGHPPWSNGYEMIVFVAWALMLFGILFHRRSGFVLPLASIFSGTLLFVSYLDWLNPEITNLMPVLKSYWLKIHVAIIISSYAPLALSALLGLMSLVLILVDRQGAKNNIQVKIKELTYINEMSMTIGLFLLSIGTFLGGVWANESWGRYWAWDPKETWALISIIVYAVVLHMRLVPSLNNRFALNAASVYAFYSIVMTSFGVNYYLTGLHSYATGDPVPIPTFVYVTLATILAITIGSGIRFAKHKKIS